MERAGDSGLCHGLRHIVGENHFGAWNVPIAQEAFGTCASGSVYSSTWIGIDGFSSSPDVLQAGTESDASCSNNVTSATYYPWYEWYPNYETRITNLAVHPGDDITTVVQAINDTTGSAYILDSTTNQNVLIQFSAPAGTHLIGNTAEWILERPAIGGILANLQNYVADFVGGADVILNDGKNTVVFATGGSSGFTGNQVTMLDNSGKPISIPADVAPYIFELNDTGSAK